MLDKLKEAVVSVLPIALIVLGASLFLGFDFSFIFKFLFATIFLILGLALFTLGADISMVEIGHKIGSYLAKKNWLVLTLLSALFLGVIITIAEPDLVVLASQVEGSISSTLLILSIALGVGIFMVLSILRIRFNLPLNIILLISYALVFVLACFLPSNFYPLAFDSGSVTTGPISVPFIMAFGIGLAMVGAKGKTSDDSFGTVGLVSVGPIIAVMLMGLFINTGSMEYTFSMPHTDSGILNIIGSFFTHLPSELLSVCIIVLPILAFFLVFQIFALRLPFKNILKIFLGLLYVIIGITLFLGAVNFAYLSTGQSLGLKLASLEHRWIIVAFFALIGLVIVLAEPAVHVLAKQIETVTSGVVSKKAIFIALCIGVAVALTLVSLRIIFGINILFILFPVFTLCFILSFISPKIFTGIAFDSGGVVTGAMSTTFVLPMIIGIVYTIWGQTNILIDAFGSMAIVASAPILAVLIIGVIYKYSTKKTNYIVKTKKPVIVDFK